MSSATFVGSQEDGLRDIYACIYCGSSKLDFELQHEEGNGHVNVKCLSCGRSASWRETVEDCRRGEYDEHQILIMNLAHRGVPHHTKKYIDDLKVSALERV